MAQPEKRPTTFTLDTNCIIDIECGRENAPAVQALVNAHDKRVVNVHVIAMMASEKQSSGEYLDDFSHFTARLTRLGLDHLPHVLPLCFWGISYWGHSLLSSPEANSLDKSLHGILFPNISETYPENGTDREKAKWRNAKCDVQALWSHINAGNDVFVTADENFHLETRLPGLLELGVGKILRPAEAAALTEP